MRVCECMLQQCPLLCFCGVSMSCVGTCMVCWYGVLLWCVAMVMVLCGDAVDLICQQWGGEAAITTSKGVH